MAAKRSSVWRPVFGAPVVLFSVLLLFVTPVAPVIAAPSEFAATTKPVYKFTIQIAVASATADRAGGYVYALSKALTQFDHINHAFNDSGVFKATYAFNIMESHEYFDSTANELARPHPTTNLKVVYDEDAGNGGWESNIHTILHSWPAAQGGDFSPDATDGLVHEVGHFRGATDEYAGDVDAATNPVNLAAYRAPNSVMSYPYGVHNWSAYAIGLINMQGNRTDEPSPALASKALPPLQVHAVNASGKAISARLRFYPVRWYSHSVTSTATVDKYTSATTGYYKFSSSPFKPTSPSVVQNPWDLTYCSFLVRATYGGKTVDTWLPVATASASYFKSPTSPYTLNIHF